MAATLHVGVAAERIRAIAGPEAARILFHVPTCWQGFAPLLDWAPAAPWGHAPTLGSLTRLS